MRPRKTVHKGILAASGSPAGPGVRVAGGTVTKTGPARSAAGSRPQAKMFDKKRGQTK
jgi:hypothetical protein